MKRLLLSLALASPLFAWPHDPAVSRTHIAFVEAGRLWLVPRSGGAARALTDVRPYISAPRFSPDGETIAFTSREIYTVSVRGGALHRVTYLPSEALLTQWTADGRLLFSTNSLSFSRIEMQLFTVSPQGGLPERLPLEYGTEGVLDANGNRLAYTPRWSSSLIANWRRYRGGSAPDIDLVDLRTHASRSITEWTGTDRHPMWSGDTIYYVSDDGAEERMNVWSYDTKSGARRQLTHLRDYDVVNPSIGSDAIVFEHGAQIELLDLRSVKTSPIRATIPETPPLQRDVDASNFITFTQNAGGNVLVEARGDVWVGAPNAAPRNLTATSGAFEREASLRPDGRAVAYWSDATGEYQLYIRELDDASDAKPLTSYTNGFRARPVWSPDGKRLAFTDQTGAITMFDVATRKLTEVDVEPWNAGIEAAELAWSADSTWLAYTKTASNRLSAIWRYDVAGGTRQQLTSDAFNASTPVFDAAGEHLFFIGYRNFNNAVSDWIQSRIVHRGLGAIMDVPLRGMTFDVASFERRASRLPSTSGSITSLSVTPDGNPLYDLIDLAGNSSRRTFDMRARKETITDAKEPSVDKSAMKVRIDLRAEWRELFDDAWREYRDVFFAPKQPLADWPGVKARYARLIEQCRTREEVNLVLASMIGESRVGHAYIGAGGDVTPRAPSDAATFGADFAVDHGAFRITRIYEGAPWDDTVRSPLRDAHEGETLLAINGKPLDITQDPRAAIAGLAGKEVQVTLGPNQRVITITPLATEFELRRRAWIERNRMHVADASGGRIGYIHIPDFNQNGFSDFVRQFYGQIDKDALIIDARWSSGGSIGAVLAELLARRNLNFAANRYSKEAWPAPRFGVHPGRKALIVNNITVSAGENFSFYFRKLALGPIVGARTWGGLTGLNPVPSLIDGGAVNVPNAPFFDDTGWLIEGQGLEPDVKVERDPAASDDAQLDAAIAALRNR